MKFKGIDETTHQQILTKVNELSLVEEKSFQFSPSGQGQFENHDKP